MKRLAAVCALLALGGCVAPGMDIVGGMMGGMNPLGGMANAAMAQANMTTGLATNNLMAAQAAAQANANRPGDAQMSCDAIQAEMTVMFQDPQFVGTIATLTAQAQSEMARAQGAQAGAVATGAAMTGLGAASSFIPGGGWLAQGAMQAQFAATLAQIPSSAQRGADMIGNMTLIMPQLMRGERLNTLATGKSCAFLKNAPPA